MTLTLPILIEPLSAEPFNDFDQWVRNQQGSDLDGLTLEAVQVNIGLPVNGSVRHIRDFDPARYRRRRIATGEHCFGCTAGCGSSCTDALASRDS